jgi:hypothetical protein
MCELAGLNHIDIVLETFRHRQSCGFLREEARRLKTARLWRAVCRIGLETFKALWS